jgi:DNA-binding protein HU-beta
VNKQGLVKAIANATGMNQQQAGEALDAITSSIQSALAAGESVKIVGFGEFLPKVRPARMGRNPKTGEAVAIPESRVPAFKAGKQLKAAL